MGKKVKAMEQFMVGILLVLIVLGAGWLLVVYNRMMNLVILAAEQRRSIEKHCRMRHQYESLKTKEDADLEQVETKLGDLDRKIEGIRARHKDTIEEFQHFCQCLWVRPALFLMGMNNAENHVMEQNPLMTGKK